MVIKSARIKWFLELQQASHFPRYQLAPFPKIVSFRRATMGQHETADLAVAKQFQPATRRPISAAVQSPRAVDMLASQMGAGVPGLLPGFRPARLTSLPASGQAPSRPYTLPLEAFHKDALTSNLDWAALARRSRTASLAGETRRVLPVINAAEVRLMTPSQFAPNAAPAQTKRAMTSATRDMKGSDNLSVEIRPTQVSSLVSHPGYIAHEDWADSTHLDSSDSDGSPPTMRKTQSKASASTLHLDGAALGRWTVQHLTRTLGKPAAGMTGVDPRAVPPRSRIQPF
jgi:hypothetical protein